MTAVIQPDVWLRFMEDEYVNTYIRNGGCSVKFAVTFEEQSVQCVREGLLHAGGRIGYLVAKVSASDTKIHMMDEIFFRTAEQLPWRALSRQVIRALAAKAGYAWPSALPEMDEMPLGDRLASANNIDPQTCCSN
jgi:hypothetical protein